MGKTKITKNSRRSAATRTGPVRPLTLPVHRIAPHLFRELEPAHEIVWTESFTGGNRKDARVYSRLCQIKSSNLAPIRPSVGSPALSNERHTSPRPVINFNILRWKSLLSGKYRPTEAWRWLVCRAIERPYRRELSIGPPGGRAGCLGSQAHRRRNLMTILIVGSDSLLIVPRLHSFLARRFP